MNGEAFERLVHAIFQYGIQLKNRLNQGEDVSLPNEQALLKRMLLESHEARRWAEYGGEPSSVAATGQGPQFLGIRYALVCWLDEIFLSDSSWSNTWNENKLEVALYGSNDRAWRFWEQARLAEKRQKVDAVWGFLLCVLLGFRGELREDPLALQAWSEGARIRLETSNPDDWVRPPERTPPTKVPPLRGRERLQRMVLSAGALLLFIVPMIAFFVVWNMVDAGGP